MTPKMKEAAEKALQYQGLALKDDSHLAHGIMLKPDGTVNMYGIDNDFMSSWQNKNKLALMLLKEMFEHKGPLAFASDAWKGVLPPWMDRAAMPNDLGDWPAEFRSEVLMCCVNQVGEKGAYAEQRYTRCKGQIVLGRISWEMPASGRFVFDLRHRNLKRAVADAVSRTREGYSSIQ